MKQLTAMSFLGLMLLLGYWLPSVWWFIHISYSSIWQWPDEFPFWNLALTTFGVSLFVGLLSTVFAYPFAIAWRVSSNFPRRLILTIMAVPLLMGLLARNYSWIGLLSSQSRFTSSSIGRFLNDNLLFSRAGVIAVMSTVVVPVAFFILLQAVRAVRQEQTDAASTLGVPHWRVIFSVIIPMTKREALLSTSYNFAVALGFFVTPRMIGGGKTDFLGNGILIFVEFGQFQKASALAVTFFLLALLPAIWIMWYALRQRQLTLGR
jgi:putative spermidine/putrescine transport system permease protein